MKKVPEVMEKMPGIILTVLSQIKNECKALGYEAYIVGGAVRDMLLKSSLSDIDITVVGNIQRLARNLEKKHGCTLSIHPSFKTLTLHTEGNCRIDIATARREVYPEPAALPEVCPSNLYDDLKRRDFTINSMAISLEDYGLIDPFGGLRDLESGIIRVLHDNSFMDDPTRIMRGIRFQVRYGFRMDNNTEELIRRSVAGGYPGRLSKERVLAEMENILKERWYSAMLYRLEEVGLWKVLFGGSEIPRSTYKILGRIQNSRERNVLFPVLAILEGIPDVRLGGTFTGYRTWYQKLQAYRAREKALGLPVMENPLDNGALYKLFNGVDKKILEYLYATACEEQYRTNIINYMRNLMDFEFHINGSLLLSLGVEPGPRYKAILERAKLEIVERGVVDRGEQVEILKSAAMKEE